MCQDIEETHIFRGEVISAEFVLNIILINSNYYKG